MAEKATKKTTITKKVTKKVEVPKAVLKEVGVATIDAINVETAELAVTEAIENSELDIKKDKSENLEVKKDLAKAGKRSSKAIKEQAELDAKEERKVLGDQDDKPKHVQKPPRSKQDRASKKMREAYKLVDKTKEHSLKEAINLAIKTSTTKFDGTIELHARLNVDPKQADQNIRDNLILPGGTGRKVRVAVLADVDDVARAKKAGAEIAGSDDFLQQLEKGVIEFDVLIATPAFMPKLGKYARVLGPKGLMPNPKSGTVTNDITKAVTEAKAGKVEYRVDGNGIVHIGVGKVSFGSEKLSENIQAVFASLKNAKPSSIKGSYVISLYLTTTMGPSVKIANSEL